MSNFIKLDENFAIDGSPETFQGLAQYKSILYLCPDLQFDSAVPGGFPAITKALPASVAVHLSVAASDACFQVNCAVTGLGLHGAIAKYAEVERALDALPRPTIILCKSNRRAGLMWATYMGVKSSMSFEEVMEMASTKGLSFTASPGFVAWCAAVVDTVRKPQPVLFRQMFEVESSAYTCLLADHTTKECILSSRLSSAIWPSWKPSG